MARTPNASASAAHPGVSYKQHKGIPNSYRLRWRDLDGRECSEVVRGKSAADVELYAVQIYLGITHARARRDGEIWDAKKAGRDVSTVGAKSAARHRIDDACKQYMQEHIEAKKRPDGTKRNQWRGLKHFLQWCAAKRIEYLDELTADVMKAWRDFERVRPMRYPRDGRTTYKISAVNQILKPVRTVLRERIGLGHVPHLNELQLRRAIPHTRVAKRDDKELHGIESAYRLDVEQLHALLRAALKRDAYYAKQGWPEPPVASDLTLLLLFGLRRGEFTRAKCGDVRRHPTLGGYLQTDGKGRRKRKVWVCAGETTYTRVGWLILRKQAAGRAKDEWLSHWKYAQLQHVITRLHRDWSSPSFTSHDLRATTATYQLAIRHYNPQLGCKRLGHAYDENEQTYVSEDMPDDVRMPADSLEHAMRARKLFREVLASMDAHPRAARPSVDAAGRSTRVRYNPAAADTSWLSKDPRDLADALARMPAIAV